MMDADAMYPEGWHPIRLYFKPDRSGHAEHTSRTAAKVKYYFIDFGISVYIPENLRPKLVTGIDGRDRDPPELSKEEPYDPFKLDVFIIGNMLRREFEQVMRIYYVNQPPLMISKEFSNFNFFTPLVERMTQQDPLLRPTAEEVLAQWQGIRKSISVIHREWRPRPRKEPVIGGFVLDVISLHQFFMFCARSLVERVRS